MEVEDHYNILLRFFLSNAVSGNHVRKWITFEKGSMSKISDFRSLLLKRGTPKMPTFRWLYNHIETQARVSLDCNKLYWQIELKDFQLRRVPYVLPKFVERLLPGCLHGCHWTHLHQTLPHVRQSAESDFTRCSAIAERESAAGCVIVFAKSRRLQLGDNILRHYRSIFNHCDVIGLKICRIRWKKRKIRAITAFKVIQGHRGRYQSKARMRFPISD